VAMGTLGWDARGSSKNGDHIVHAHVLIRGPIGPAGAHRARSQDYPACPDLG
jgi:hypothetical protein